MKKILSSSKANNFPEKFIYLQQIISHEMLQRLHVKLAILTVLALRFRWGFSSKHVHKKSVFSETSNEQTLEILKSHIRRIAHLYTPLSIYNSYQQH